MIIEAAHGANADPLYACSSRRFITIHDGGLYHGEELFGDLHLTPGRDKASWSAHVQTSTRTPARGLSDLPSEWDLARPSIPGISIDRHLIPPWVGLLDSI
jgi:hypothetical protein